MSESQGRSPVKRVVLVVVLLVVVGALSWLAWLAWVMQSMVFGKPGVPTGYGERLVKLSTQAQGAADPDGRAWLRLVKVVNEIQSAEQAARDATIEAIAPDDPLVSSIPVEHSSLHDFESALAENRRALENEFEEDLDAQAHRYTEIERQIAMAAIERAERDRLISALDDALMAPAFQRAQFSDALFEAVVAGDMRAMREISRHLAGRMALARDADDPDAYASELRRGLEMGRAAESSPLLLMRLSAMGIRTLFTNRVQDDLRAQRIDARFCAEALRVIDQFHRPMPLGFTFDAEQLLASSIVQVTHTDDGKGDGRLLLHTIGSVAGVPTPGGAPPYWGNAIGVLAPTKRQTIAALDELYDTMRSRAEMTHAERAAAGETIEALVDELGIRYRVVAIAAPAFERSVSAAEIELVHRDAARIMLAIECYRHEQGALPADLEALTPTWMEETPRDPFASDGAFRYRIAAESPLGYTLYSVGADGVDDEGVFDTIAQGIKGVTSAFSSDAAGDEVFVGP